MAQVCLPGLLPEMGTTLEEKVLSQRQSGGRPCLVLDMSNVMFLGDAELAILLRVRDLIEASQGQFVLVGLRSYCLNLAMMTELSRQFELHPTAASAFEALRPRASTI